MSFEMNRELQARAGSSGGRDHPIASVPGDEQSVLGRRAAADVLEEGHEDVDRAAGKLARDQRCLQLSDAGPKRSGFGEHCIHCNHSYPGHENKCKAAEVEQRGVEVHQFHQRIRRGSARGLLRGRHDQRRADGELEVSFTVTNVTGEERERGVLGLFSTETGAGQWGSALAFASILIWCLYWAGTPLTTNVDTLVDTPDGFEGDIERSDAGRHAVTDAGSASCFELGNLADPAGGHAHPHGKPVLVTRVIGEEGDLASAADDDRDLLEVVDEVLHRARHARLG